MITQLDRMLIRRNAWNVSDNAIREMLLDSGAIYGKMHTSDALSINGALTQYIRLSKELALKYYDLMYYGVI